MPININAICRGRERVFIGVDAGSSPDGPITLEANVYLEDKKVPASSLPIEHPSLTHVVVIPEMANDVTVDLTTKAPDGRVFGFFSQKVTHFQAKWQSRIQGRTNSSLISSIRNYDDGLTYDCISLSLFNVIVKPNGELVIHGTITGPASWLNQGVDLSLMDVAGNTVCTEWIQTLCTTRLIENVFEVREIQFSMTIPHIPGNFIFKATTNEHEGFEVVSAQDMNALCKLWELQTTPADKDSDYEDWFLEKHRCKPCDLALQRERVFSHNAKFSIIVPLFKTPLNFLEEMANSALSQTYSNLELILVNASPEDLALAQAVSDLEKRDARVKIVTLEENLGITENTNFGTAVATGDFVCFFDHDDVLEPDALYEYAKALEDDPEIDLFYCDEDKLMDGKYSMPYFKPDFNPDLVRSINYVCHFLTVRRSIIEQLDTPTKEYDGAQDWHLTFRAWENGRHMHHVSRILYHWRIHANSTAMTQEEKPYAHIAAKLALQHHLDRQAPGAVAVESPLVPYNYCVDYPIVGDPLVSVVIPNKDSVSVLSRCIDSIHAKTSYTNFEIVIIENNSTEPATFEYYRELEESNRARVEKFQPSDGFNFSEIMNYGVSCAKGDYLLLLNNDTEVIEPSWMSLLLGNVQRPEVGAVGAKLFFPDGCIQHAGIGINLGGGPGHFNYLLPRENNGFFNTASLAQDFDAVTAACMMVERATFEKVGGFNQELKVDYNDVDLCLKIREEGLLCVFEPRVQLYHYESVSRGRNNTPKKIARQKRELFSFAATWADYFTGAKGYLQPNHESSAYFTLDKR